MANPKRNVNLTRPRPRPMHGARPRLETNSICTLLSLPTTTSNPIVENQQHDKAAIVDTYINSMVQETSHKPQVAENLKKLCHLDIMKNNSTQKQPRESKKRVSRSQKHLLGIRSINKKVLKFRDFLPLHNLWKEYMKTFLNFEFLKKQGFTGRHTDKQWKQLSIRLLRVDYQGAILRVIRSICSSHVGLKGIVVHDTKGTYSLLGRDNIIRTIPKMGSAFVLKCEEFEFTIYGRDMCIRPHLRSVKKIKKYLIADI